VGPGSEGTYPSVRHLELVQEHKALEQQVLVLLPLSKLVCSTMIKGTNSSNNKQGTFMY
jgi:hypothetical protein